MVQSKEEQPKVEEQEPKVEEQEQEHQVEEQELNNSLYPRVPPACLYVHYESKSTQTCLDTMSKQDPILL